MDKAFSAIVALMLATLPVGAPAQTATPVAVVNAAYTCVFSHSCPEAKARAYLTSSFAREFATVDALAARCRCEVIDASPWVDAQAGPAAFAVGNAVVTGGTAYVPIHFSDGKSGAYSMKIATARTAAGWAISDILTRDGKSTAAMMAAAIASTRNWLASPGATLRQFQMWHYRASVNGSLLQSFESGKSFFTPAFARDVHAKLSQAVDPFTLSASRVADWEFGAAQISGDTATSLARLQMTNGTYSRVLYHLQRIGGRWAISGVSRP